MKITSPDGTSAFRLEALAGENGTYLNLLASVSDEGFCGTYDGIWVDRETFQKFMAALRQCEQTRRGQARLVSLSPGELELVIESCDGWGHFIVKYQLGKMTYTSHTTLVKSVVGGFDLNAEFFAPIVSEFAELWPILKA